MQPAAAPAGPPDAGEDVPIAESSKGAVAGISDAAAAPPPPPPAPTSDSSAAETAAVEPAVPPSSQSDDEEDGAEASGAGYESSSESEADVADLIAQIKAVLSVSEEEGIQLAKPSALPSFDLAGVAAYIRGGGAKRIICMVGAGISVSAGIPDFRSPGTGLYHRLEEYGLPHPHAVFELDYFCKNPNPFFLLAKELFPGNYAPTPTHHFMRLLHDKGLLLRCFTQNIDSLEHQAGLPAEAVVAAHGNFDSARCIKCGMPHPVEHVREAVFRQEGNPCYCKKRTCGGLVKPDIVFFGEKLPERFWERAPLDYSQADLLIVMGTSLVVNPFAGLIDYVGGHVPRLLVNREKAGELTAEKRAVGYTRGFDWGPSNYRDALFLGDCDDGVRRLCALLGWEAELDALIATGQQQLQAGQAGQAAAASAAAQEQGGSGSSADASTVVAAAAAAAAEGSSSGGGAGGAAAVAAEGAGS